MYCLWSIADDGLVSIVSWIYSGVKTGTDCTRMYERIIWLKRPDELYFSCRGRPFLPNAYFYPKSFVLLEY